MLRNVHVNNYVMILLRNNGFVKQPNKKRKMVFAVYDDVFEIHRSSIEGMTSSQRDNIRAPIPESQDCFDLSNSQSVQRIIVRSRALKGIT